jgi:ribokinase
MIDVAAVGSLHLDIMVAAPRLPGRDETLIGSAWYYKCGGKGGNQAVAAARFGARTAFGGQTGRDDFGQRLRANLTEAGVDITHVGFDPEHGSGMSVAISEEAGEYGAVVVSGANLTIDPNAIETRWEQLWRTKVMLLQNEIPEAVSITAAHNARGAEGLSLMTRDGVRTDIPALPVKLVSAHGAGDCFCGTLAARIAAGEDLGFACRLASAAAARLVSTPRA